MNQLYEPLFSTDLSGHTALVTGASSGLGRHFALTLARCGARVAVTGRRLERLNAVVEAIQAIDGTAAAFQLDVTDADQLLRTVAAVEKTLGMVTILVNNAGTSEPDHEDKPPLEVVDLVLNTNLRAPIILSQEVARRLIAAKRPGRIINIASMAAYVHPKNIPLYSISKAAIIRMTEAFAMDWVEHHINVNAIAPGVVASGLVDRLVARAGDISQGFPRRRIGDPAQLDSTLLYFASPSSDFVTGTCIKVDDGQFSR